MHAQLNQAAAIDNAGVSPLPNSLILQFRIARRLCQIAQFPKLQNILLQRHQSLPTRVILTRESRRCAQRQKWKWAQCHHHRQSQIRAMVVICKKSCL
jgi:hypothetical protein